MQKVKYLNDQRNSCYRQKIVAVNVRVDLAYKKQWATTSAPSVAAAEFEL